MTLRAFLGAVLLLAGALLGSAHAYAQGAVLQGGAWTYGDFPSYCSNGTQSVICDSGFSLSSLPAGGTAGQVQYNNAGSLGGFTLSGDCTLAIPTITCLQSNGQNFGTAAFVNTGTAGGTVPLLNTNLTFSGTDNFTGQLQVNGSAITLGGAFTLSGAHTFTGTLPNNTSVTFPSSGTLISSSTGLSGAVTGTPSSTTYLRGDGTWATISSSATSITVGTTAVTSGTNGYVLYDNSGNLGNEAASSLVFTTGTLSLSGNLTTSGAYADTLTFPGAYTYTFPGATSTLATPSVAQTWSAAQTFPSSDILILGSSTGYTALASANAGSSNYTLTFPAATDTVTTNAATQTLTNKTISGSSNTLSNIGNTSLTNYTMTIGGQSIALGGSTTNQGNGSKIQLGSGSLTSGDCLQADSSGNVVDAGGPCTTGGGGGTVSSGVAGNLPYYASSGTAVTGNANLNVSSGVLTAGIAGSVVGGYAVANATSGSITLSPPTGALGSAVLTLPDATDTLADLAGSQTFTNKTYSGGTLSGTIAGTATLSGTLTLSGTDNFTGTFQTAGHTMTFPGSAATLAGLGIAETWTAAQTFTNSDILLLGSSTGATTFTSANSSATNYTITVPAITDTLVTLTATQTLTNKSIAASEVNSGQLALAQGGTAANLAASNGGIVYSGASALAILGGTSTAGLPLLSGSNTAPTWGSDANIAYIDVAQSFTAAQRVPQSTITISSSTFTPNFNTGQDFNIALSSSCPCTVANPSTTPVAGQHGVFAIAQDSSGSRTIGTWGSQYKFPGGTAPTLSTAASAVDFCPYDVYSATQIVVGACVLNAK